MVNMAIMIIDTIESINHKGNPIVKLMAKLLGKYQGIVREKSTI